MVSNASGRGSAEAVRSGQNGLQFARAFALTRRTMSGSPSTRCAAAARGRNDAGCESANAGREMPVNKNNSSRIPQRKYLWFMKTALTANVRAQKKLPNRPQRAGQIGKLLSGKAEKIFAQLLYAERGNGSIIGEWMRASNRQNGARGGFFARFTTSGALTRGAQCIRTRLDD